MKLTDAELDIVRRAKAAYDKDPVTTLFSPMWIEMLCDAADEIAALQAEVERLQAELDEMKVEYKVALLDLEEANRACSVKRREYDRLLCKTAKIIRHLLKARKQRDAWRRRAEAAEKDLLYLMNCDEMVYCKNTKGGWKRHGKDPVEAR